MLWAWVGFVWVGKIAVKGTVPADSAYFTSYE